MHGLFWGYGGMPHWGSQWYGYAGSTWWNWAIMGGTLLLGIVTVILLAVLLSRHRRSSNDGSEALQILRRRYANGEIDKETFDSMMKDLR